jgi:hypothetical protein
VVVLGPLGLIGHLDLGNTVCIKKNDIHSNKVNFQITKS